MRHQLTIALGGLALAAITHMPSTLAARVPPALAAPTCRVNLTVRNAAPSSRKNATATVKRIVAHELSEPSKTLPAWDGVQTIGAGKTHVFKGEIVGLECAVVKSLTIEYDFGDTGTHEKTCSAVKLDMYCEIK